MGTARNYEAFSGTSGGAVVLTPDFDAPAKAWVFQNTSSTATDEVTFTLVGQAIKVRGGQTKRIAMVADAVTVSGSGAGYVVRAADIPGAIDVAIESAGSGGGGDDAPQAVTAAGPTAITSGTVLVNFTGLPTVTLPASPTSGKGYTVKDTSGAAGTGSNNITIATAAAETIDGAATATIASDYGSLTMVYDGANFHIT